jgi:DNA-binding transcriptional ArsR family regulator
MGPKTTAESVDTVKEPESVVRGHLARLVEMGLVESRGPSRSRRHHLTAAFYRLAQSSEYVRLQDTDPIQHEHMSMAYVEQFGSITRGKAEELCHLSPGQARTAPRRLTEAARLQTARRAPRCPLRPTRLADLRSTARARNKDLMRPFCVTGNRQTPRSSGSVREHVHAEHVDLPARVTEERPQPASDDLERTLAR